MIMIIKTSNRAIPATHEILTYNSDVLVSRQSQVKSVMEPPVFHMQHIFVSADRVRTRCNNVSDLARLSLKSLIGSGIVLASVGFPNLALAKDQPCIDYYTVGESVCKPVASTPVQGVQTSPKAPAISPQEQSEVDKYLANYGKPPREFVEFYLNPTPENATKWVAAYQQLLQKGQDISKAWNQADELYKTQRQPLTTYPAVIEQPLEMPAAPIVPQPVLQPAQSSPPRSFGGFADRAAAIRSSTGGVAQTPVNLTYYFSQTCPYCARTTPDLSIISKEMSGKLAFTCVDVTPLSATNRPNESYITSKLPCNWRLPEEGEVEREGVRQTPTLVIQKAGQAPMRLSGYVPLQQLRTYF